MGTVELCYRHLISNGTYVLRRDAIYLRHSTNNNGATRRYIRKLTVTAETRVKYRTIWIKINITATKAHHDGGNDKIRQRSDRTTDISKWNVQVSIEFENIVIIERSRDVINRTY